METEVDIARGDLLEIGKAHAGLGYDPGHIIFFQQAAGTGGQPAVVAGLQRKIIVFILMQQQFKKIFRQPTVEPERWRQLQQHRPKLLLYGPEHIEETGERFFRVL